MSYYNTTHVLGKKLHEYTEKAKCQEEKILRLFMAYPTHKYTASHVWMISFKQNLAIRATVPLTSVRRALTNLYNAGYIIKTDKQAIGEYGRPEYYWKLAPQYSQGDLFK
jgi:hypothetical protein